MICECGPKAGPFQLDDPPITVADALKALGVYTPLDVDDPCIGLIICLHCKGLYRPAHKRHKGGGTPDHCGACKRYLALYASSQAQK